MPGLILTLVIREETGPTPFQQGDLHKRCLSATWGDNGSTTTGSLGEYTIECMAAALPGLEKSTAAAVSSLASGGIRGMLARPEA